MKINVPILAEHLDFSKIIFIISREILSLDELLSRKKLNITRVFKEKIFLLIW